MSRLVYWSSRTQNTHRFVEGLGIEAIRLPMSLAEGLPQMLAPFVLVVPTFGSEEHTAVPRPVTEFLTIPGNAELLRGVIAGGNRNFGDTFGLAGKLISIKLSVPCLYRFELAGTPEDTDRVRQGLERFWTR